MIFLAAALTIALVACVAPLATRTLTRRKGRA